MTRKIYLRKFDGGHAEDVRGDSTDECEFSKNFDIFTNPHKLIPYGDSVAETVSGSTMDDIEIDNVDVSLIGSSYIMTGAGYESGSSAKPAFFTKADIVTTFSSQAVAAGNTYVKNSLVVFREKAYALGWNGSNQITLYRYNSGGSVTAAGTVAVTEVPIAKPFVHPEDNVLYIVCGNVIATFTIIGGTDTMTTYSTILPTGFQATSQCDYGNYLAIAMRPLRGNGNSVTYLWGRDGTINTLQGTIDFGEGSINLLENLDNNLFAVMTPQTTLFTNITNKITVKGYAGGAVETIKSITNGSTATATIYKQKNGGKVYFGFANDDAIYAFGKNKSGKYIITKDRYLFNGTTIGSSFSGVSMIGDVMWRAFTTLAGVFTLMRSKVAQLGESITYTSTSTYRTLVNPSMPLEDRYTDKLLKGVRIAYTGATTGTTVLKYSVNGGAFTTIISDTNAAGEQCTEANTESDGVPLGQGREFQFQVETTGGAQVKEIDYYYDNLPSTNGL